MRWHRVFDAVLAVLMPSVRLFDGPQWFNCPYLPQPGTAERMTCWSPMERARLTRGDRPHGELSRRQRLAHLAAHHVPKPVRYVVRLAVVALVVEYLLVPQIAGSRNSWHLLLQADVGWLAVGAACEAASLLAYAALTQRLIPARERPTYGRVLRIDLSTLAVSHVVPAGSAVGLGLGYQLLTEAGVVGVDAATVKATQAVGSALVLNVMLWAALAASIGLHGFSSVYGPVALVGLVLMSTAAGLVVATRKRERQIAQWMGRWLGRLPFLTAHTVEAAVIGASHYLRDFLSNREQLGVTTLWAAANWLLDAAALWACVRAFGHALGPVGLLVPYGIANVLAALPITPAGLGVVEAFLIPALVGFSVPRGTAILGVLAWRALNFLAPIPIGLAAYLSLPPRSRPPE
jgi:uncharacterized protein (TIRG00374 family)